MLRYNTKAQAYCTVGVFSLGTVHLPATTSCSRHFARKEIGDSHDYYVILQLIDKTTETKTKVRWS